jgi:hypothetical protein
MDSENLGERSGTGPSMICEEVFLRLLLLLLELREATNMACKLEEDDGVGNI